MEELTPRDRILTTALRLFNQNGAHATGIDQIIAESAVAKRTFYHHFPSKNALLAEFFRQKHEEWYNRFLRHTSDQSQPPLERVLALFDALQEWYSQPDFHGCAFIRGLSDFSANCESDPELIRLIGNHFARTEKLVTTLLQAARPQDYPTFIPPLLTLIAGSTIIAHATHNPKIAEINKATARTLLTAAEVKKGD